MSDAELRPALEALASHLAQRREAILRAWHAALDADPELTSFSHLSRAQFNDHIPAVLDAFALRLREADASPEADAQASPSASAAEHGLSRWQQGFDQRQTMREWAHLQLCLLAEFEAYEAAHPGLNPAVRARAHRVLTRVCSDGVIESATRYMQLQQADAEARLRDLEQALQQLQQLERVRAEGWRQAAHDLRGTVGIISNASAILSRQVSEPLRARFAQILQRGVTSLHTLLSDLIDVARLEAGHERRRIAPFDAARLLSNFCDSLRETVTGGGLFLAAQGPESLPVLGDEAKVLRIAQNLMLNALKATEQGGLRVTWEALPEQWRLTVQDTGPGITRGSAASLERALRDATAEARDLNAGERERAAPMLASQSGHVSPEMLAGEGIGLSIVKRLCELLDAAIELETAPGSGTTFRVTFPLHYADAIEGPAADEPH